MYIPLTDMTDAQWHDAWDTMFNPKLAAHMGVNPDIIANRPTLVQFFQNIMAAYDANKFRAWGIVRDGEYLGHVVLDKSAIGEWEVGTSVRNPENWNSGIGVRATLHALQWAFEEDGAEWVVAYTQGEDLNVPRILKRGGFRRLANLWVMDQRTWQDRWAKRLTKETE